MKHTRVSFDLVRVRKEGARALVTGIAYPALDPPGEGAISAEDAALRIDTYKTWMRRDTLRKFAHTFLKRGTGGVDAHHDHGTVGTIVESYLTPEGHPDFPADVWVVTSEVYDPGILQQLADEKIKGYSIEFVSEIRPVTLTIEGAGKVRTGEIVDPTPLFLSLVEKPAIRQPFRAVEFRAEAEETPPDCGRVTRLVRCEEPMPNDDDAPTAPETRAEAPATTPPATEPPVTPPPPPAAEVRTDAPAETATETKAPAATDGASIVQVMRDEFARLVAGGTRSRAAERLGYDHATTIDTAVRAAVASRRTAQTRAEVSMFKEVWDANHAKWAVMDAMGSAFYLMEGCYYECIYYASGTLEARITAFIACLDDFRVVLVDLAAEAATVESRAAIDALRAKAATLHAHARAGKSLSKKNMDKIKGCRDHARACADDLQSMVDEYGGEDTADGEGEEEGERNARAAKEPPAPETKPADEPTVELTELRARVEALTTESRTTAETLATRDAELTALKAELDAARAAQAAAEKRAQELAEAPAPPRAQSIERGSETPATPTQPVSRWAGFAEHVIPPQYRPNG